MSLITTTQQLEEVCNRLRKADFVTVDTEFLRESTFYSQLCLVQLADDDGAFAVDPLADDIDLSALQDLLADKNVLKVLHACRQDVEIFYEMMGKVPAPMFDTQIAAMVCGFGESAGYETLVKKITKRSIDKSARYTDWSRRPLTDRQINYALSDVTHLRDVYRYLAGRLQASGRSSWVAEEMAVVLAEETYENPPEEAWHRLKPRSTNPRFLGILRAVAAWRENEAMNRNLPRRRVMKDELLLEIAAHPPEDAKGLERVRGMPKGFGNSQGGKSLLEAVALAKALPEDQLPSLERARGRPPTPPMAELLKVLLKIKCEKAGVAAKLISSTAEIESWAANPSDEWKALKGWRGEIYGNDARKLVDGDLALTIHNGDIDLVELEPFQDD